MLIFRDVAIGITTKHSKVINLWPPSMPDFERGHPLHCLCRTAILKVYRSWYCLSPVAFGEIPIQQHGASWLNQSPVEPLSYSILLWRLRNRSFMPNSFIFLRYDSNLLNVYSLPLSVLRVRSFHLHCFSTSAFHLRKQSNTWSFVFMMYTQVYLDLSSVKVRKYSPPPRDFSCIFPHTSECTSSRISVVWEALLTKGCNDVYQ